MILTFRPIDVWPGPMTRERKAHYFKTTWSDTLALLDSELRAINVIESTVVLQLAASESDFRLDGKIRANARLAHPGVILSFESKKSGLLSFPCDTFTEAYSWHQLEGWQANVRAIALGLEALRKIDRYGIANTGQQYTGWKALGTGTPMPAAKMTVEEAARFLAHHAGDAAVYVPGRLIVDVPIGVRAVAYKRAAKKLHPDAGGDPELFKRLTEAMKVLEAKS